jgi:hypothetical protein
MIIKKEKGQLQAKRCGGREESQRSESSSHSRVCRALRDGGELVSDFAQAFEHSRQRLFTQLKLHGLDARHHTFLRGIVLHLQNQVKQT